VWEPLELISDLLSCPYVQYRTVECTHPEADYELVTLVAIIFRVSHKVMVKGSLTVPGKDIGQTHSAPWRVNPQLLRGSLHQGISLLSRFPT
jgi:hypothetical protein